MDNTNKPSMKKDWKIRKNKDLKKLGIEPGLGSMEKIRIAYFKMAKGLLCHDDTHDSDGRFGKNEERFKDLVRAYERLQHNAYGDKLNSMEGCKPRHQDMSNFCWDSEDDDEDDDEDSDENDDEVEAGEEDEEDEEDAHTADSCPGFDCSDNFYDLHRDYFGRGNNDITYQDFRDVFERRMYFERCRHYFTLMGVSEATREIRTERDRYSHLDRCEQRASDDLENALDCLLEARKKLDIARKHVLEVEGRVVGLSAAVKYAQFCRPHLSEGHEKRKSRKKRGRPYTNSDQEDSQPVRKSRRRKKRHSFEIRHSSSTKHRGEDVGPERTESPTKKQHAIDGRTVEIGTRIRKEFNGVIFTGRIVALPSRISEYFKVEYEDGDKEDLSENDLLDLVGPEGNKSLTKKQQTIDGRAVEIGTRIRKEFNGVFFTGRVVELPSRTSEYFKVEYEDGDKEDLSENELLDLISLDVGENKNVNPNDNQKVSEMLKTHPEYHTPPIYKKLEKSKGQKKYQLPHCDGGEATQTSPSPPSPTKLDFTSVSSIQLTRPPLPHSNAITPHQRPVDDNDNDNDDMEYEEEDGSDAATMINSVDYMVTNSDTAPLDHVLKDSGSLGWSSDLAQAQDDVDQSCQNIKHAVRGDSLLAKRPKKEMNDNLCDDACDDSRDDGRANNKQLSLTSAQYAITAINVISTSTATTNDLALITPIRRRKERRKFTLDEKRAIVKGVHELGLDWVGILAKYPVLSSRTNVNIKDCYRTLTKKRAHLSLLKEYNITI